MNCNAIPPDAPFQSLQVPSRLRGRKAACFPRGAPAENRAPPSLLYMESLLPAPAAHAIEVDGLALSPVLAGPRREPACWPAWRSGTPSLPAVFRPERSSRARAKTRPQTPTGHRAPNLIWRCRKNSENSRIALFLKLGSGSRVSVQRLLFFYAGPALCLLMPAGCKAPRADLQCPDP